MIENSSARRNMSALVLLRLSTVLNSGCAAVSPLANPGQKEEPEPSWVLQRWYVHECVTLSTSLNLASDYK